jgi:hypothetical protein
MVQRDGDPKSLPERRSGKDRRQSEAKTYKGPERRRHIEPRKPVVTELDLSQTQWDALQEEDFAAKPPKQSRQGQLGD